LKFKNIEAESIFGGNTKEEASKFSQNLKEMEPKNKILLFLPMLQKLCKTQENMEIMMIVWL
jgi:hypothetical protein